MPIVSDALELDDREALTSRIEQAAAFLADIEDFLATCEPLSAA